MKDPIPVTVIGGYLGAGKTTLINHLLHHAGGMQLAILVNDFGDLPIDATLIESRDGNVISLSGGCVCCSYGNDLQGALVQLKETDSAPDQIVIEASGVALPGAIGSSITLMRYLRLHGVITLVDASTLLTNAKDKYLKDTIERQLSDADLVVVNKSDLINEDDLHSITSLIASINPTVEVVASEHSRVATELILDNLLRESAASSVALTEAHLEHFESHAIDLPERVDVQAVATYLSTQVGAVLRAKGFVRDLDGALKTLQVVGQRATVSEAPEDAVPGLVCIGIQGTIPIEDISAQLTARCPD